MKLHITNTHWCDSKPEPIMLLVLPDYLEFPIISPLFFIYLYYSSHFITSVTVMSTLHMIAEKWVHFTAITINSF